MSRFAEIVLKEYKKIAKRTTPTKDVYYRIRVVQRKMDGILTKLLDVRQYKVTEKRFGFTESGVYFNREELNTLIEELIKAKREFFNNARDTGNRI